MLMNTFPRIDKRYYYNIYIAGRVLEIEGGQCKPKKMKSKKYFSSIQRVFVWNFLYSANREKDQKCKLSRVDVNIGFE